MVGRTRSTKTLYCLFVKRGLLDGWPGWYYALQRTIAETILSLNLLGADLGIGGDRAAR